MMLCSCGQCGTDPTDCVSVLGCLSSRQQGFLLFFSSAVRNIFLLQRPSVIIVSLLLLLISHYKDLREPASFAPTQSRLISLQLSS